MVNITQNGDSWIVAGDMTIDGVSALLEQSNNLQYSKNLNVDLKLLTEVDTTALSLMFQWMRNAATKKCEIVFLNIPENLINLATLYGVLDLIPQAGH